MGKIEIVVMLKLCPANSDCDDICCNQKTIYLSFFGLISELQGFQGFVASSHIKEH